jgi:periplasmic copper chaperone A
MIKPGWLGLAVLLYAAQSFAGEVSVSDAWSRATAPGQVSAVVGLRITSQKDARMVALSSPAAAEAQMHSMTHENGMMKMRQLDSLALPAKQEIVLGAGGDHLMLINLKKPLKAGDIIPMTLTVQFSDKSTEQLSVKAVVQPLTHGHHH